MWGREAGWEKEKSMPKLARTHTRTSHTICMRTGCLHAHTHMHTHARRHEEKERRLEQERARKAAELQVAKKLSARAAAKEYLAGLQEHVFGKLEQQGAFYNPTERDIRDEFMPWLISAVHARTQDVLTARYACVCSVCWYACVCSV